MIKFLLYLDVDKSGIIFLKPGDKVKVNLTVKAFRQLQDNDIYGGWEEGMEQVSVWATLVVNGSCLQNLTTYQYNPLFYLLVNIEGRISFGVLNVFLYALELTIVDSFKHFFGFPVSCI